MEGERDEGEEGRRRSETEGTRGRRRRRGRSIEALTRQAGMAKGR